MTPKQKAYEICDKMLQWTGTAPGKYVDKLLFAKQCSAIAIDELIKESNKTI